MRLLSCLLALCCLGPVAVGHAATGPDPARFNPAAVAPAWSRTLPSTLLAALGPVTEPPPLPSAWAGLPPATPHAVVLQVRPYLLFGVPPHSLLLDDLVACADAYTDLVALADSLDDQRTAPLTTVRALLPFQQALALRLDARHQQALAALRVLFEQGVFSGQAFRESVLAGIAVRQRLEMLFTDYQRMLETPPIDL